MISNVNIANASADSAEGLSRRRFLQLAGATACALVGASMLSGCGPLEDKIAGSTWYMATAEEGWGSYYYELGSVTFNSDGTASLQGGDAYDDAAPEDFDWSSLELTPKATGSWTQDGDNVTLTLDGLYALMGPLALQRTQVNDATALVSTGMIEGTFFKTLNDAIANAAL